jgi:hypothetical protein
LPELSNVDYKVEIDKDYNISSSSRGYFDPKYIYNQVGYWNHEIYRFGIVYILSDNTLSPVFNIRGIDNLGKSTTVFSDIPMWADDKKTSRNYIVTEEDTYKIVTDGSAYNVALRETSKNSFENSKGVVQLNWENNGTAVQQVFGIRIKTTDEVLDYIKNTLNIKGFFFVR